MSGENVKISKQQADRQIEIMELVRKHNCGRKPKALVETYGCQQNVNDSQRIMGMLEQMGYEITEQRENADVVVFNTCAVRENAEKRVFGNLGALKKLKDERPDMIIAICGCMVQQGEIANRIKKRFAHVDIIFGTFALWKFPELLSEVLEHRERLLDISGSGNIAEGLPFKHEGGAKAFVSVMYGCNNFCSYCIVPYVRGRERSRDKEDILREVRMLSENGVREVMLLGQNVNSYGMGAGEDSFSDLLKSVSEIEGIERIRFMSSHPKDISDKLLETMAENKKICNQLHLPLQSGSDKVLSDMNRRYNIEKYMEIIKKAKSLMPDIALTTDIIVGFPTETDEDFNKTLEVLENVRFDNIFSFIYSKRPGTAASKLKNVASDEEIKERFNRMLEVQTAISYERNKLHEGKTERVLVEGMSKNDPLVLSGRNYANKIVNFKGDESLKDTFADVKITKAKTWVLTGELV